jgi:hypothetical protein
MTLSMHQAAVPVVTRALTNLAAILTKAEADATTRSIDPAIFLAARLAPDMHPLTRQVQIACDSGKGIGRLAGADIPSFADTETTFPELHARIAKTIDYVQGLDAAQFEGSETRTIVLKFPRGEMSFPGQAFLLSFTLPNLFFHVTTAYGILRHLGVPLGKMDYIGAP